MPPVYAPADCGDLPPMPGISSDKKMIESPIFISAWMIFPSRTRHPHTLLGAECFLVELDGLRGVVNDQGRGCSVEAFRDWFYRICHDDFSFLL